MVYTIVNIKYDTNRQKVELPKTLSINVPDNTERDEIINYISDEISNITGFCHFGFSIKPEIKS